MCQPYIESATALSDEKKMLSGARNDFHFETKARKVMVDFKFDALYR